MNPDQLLLDLEPDEYNTLVDIVMRRKRREATKAESVARNVVRPFTNSGQTGIAPTAIALSDAEPEPIVYGPAGAGSPGTSGSPVRDDHTHPLDPTVGGDLDGDLPNPIVVKLLGEIELISNAGFYDYDQVLTITNLAPLQAEWFPAVRKQTHVIGNGVLTTFTLTHNLNTQSLRVTVIRNSSPFDPVETDVSMVNVNQVVISFNTAPTTNQFLVNILG